MHRLERIVWDLRYGLRSLTATPVFVLSCVSILALTGGALTALLSVADTVLWRPLTFNEPERLVRVWKNNLERGFDHFPTTYAEYEAWRDTTDSIAQLAAVAEAGPWNGVLLSEDRAEEVKATAVSENFFDVLGVEAMAGRLFQPSDNDETAQPPIILSEVFWRTRFAADPDIIGETIPLVFLDRRGFRVVGVLPSSIDYPEGTQAWVTALSVKPASATEENYFEAELVGRLRDGVTLASARSELQRIHINWAEESARPEMSVMMLPLLESLVGAHRATLRWFLAASALLLLLGTVNLASLFVVRNERRAPTLGLRSALGASPLSLMWQLVAESVPVALLGWLGAILVARWMISLSFWATSVNIPRLQQVTLPTSVLLGSFLILFGCTMVFAAWPAQRAVASLKQSTMRIRGSSRKASRLMDTLVIGELALALALTIGSGLLLRSLLEQMQIERGFRPDELVSVSMPLSATRYEGPRARRDFIGRAVETLEALPEVRSATPMFMRPSADEVGFVSVFRFEGQTPLESEENPWANFEMVSPNFFETLGIPLVRGRLIDDGDRLDGERVVVISQSVADDYWPGEDPIDKRLFTRETEVRVVGVVGDIRFRELTHNWQYLYFALEQNPFRAERELIAVSPSYLVVRANTSAVDTIPAIRRSLRELEAAIPLRDIVPMNQLLDTDLAPARIQVGLMSAFTFVALLLAGIGVYGTMSVLLSQRLNETGIRMALGATPSEARSPLIRHGLWLTVSGVGGGFLVALGCARLVESLLFGISSWDPATYLVAAVVLLLVGVGCTTVAASRAREANPMLLLRKE